MTNKLFLYIRPRAKQRPRYNTRTRTTYTPSETKKYEEEIALLYKEAGGEYHTGPLEIDACFVYKTSKKKQVGKYKDTRPDADNLLKALLDGLIGTAFGDDGCVVRLVATKRWGNQDCICLSIKEAEEKEDRGVYECFHCGAKAVGWDADFNSDEFGYAEGGIVHVLHCQNCGAEILYIVGVDEEDE